MEGHRLPFCRGGGDDGVVAGTPFGDRVLQRSGEGKKKGGRTRTHRSRQGRCAAPVVSLHEARGWPERRRGRSGHRCPWPGCSGRSPRIRAVRRPRRHGGRGQAGTDGRGAMRSRSRSFFVQTPGTRSPSPPVTATHRTGVQVDGRLGISLLQCGGGLSGFGEEVGDPGPERLPLLAVVSAVVSEAGHGDQSCGPAQSLRLGGQLA